MGSKIGAEALNADHTDHPALLLAVSLVAPGRVAAAADYLLDHTHLTIAFLVSHIGFAKTLGMFRTAQGSLCLIRRHPMCRTSRSRSTLRVFTNYDRRDNHLRGKDFLWVKKHPIITFLGKRAEQVGDWTGKWDHHRG